MTIERSEFDSQRKIQLAQEVIALNGENARLEAIIDSNNTEIKWRLAEIRGCFDKSQYPERTESPIDYQPTLPGLGQTTKGIIRGFRNKIINWRQVG